MNLEEKNNRLVFNTKMCWVIVSYREGNELGSLEGSFLTEDQANEYLTWLEEKAKAFDNHAHATNTHYVLFKRVDYEPEESSQETTGAFITAKQISQFVNESEGSEPTEPNPTRRVLIPSLFTRRGQESLAGI